jgi:hypothetical protein
MVRPPSEQEVAAIALWEDLLRAYAETIEEQRSYLLSLSALDQVDEATIVPPVFEVPADVPPMPASFEPWAMSLLNETAGLAEIAHQILSERPAAAPPRPQRFASSASGSSLDQKI